MKILFAAAAVAALILTAGPSLAVNATNHDCAGQDDSCTKGCDDAADQSKNARAYQRCLSNCARASRLCEARQDQTNDCAASFQSCIKNAHGDASLESCRASYRKCKEN